MQQQQLWYPKNYFSQSDNSFTKFVNCERGCHEIFLTISLKLSILFKEDKVWSNFIIEIRQESQ